jgi:hypothetical protein
MSLLAVRTQMLLLHSSMGGAGGNFAYRISAFEAVCILSSRLWFLYSSPEELHARQHERPLWAKGGSMGEKWLTKFRQTIRLHVIAGFFNMSQSCDMGQTALLPFRRKAWSGFFRPKNPTASAGIDPHSWVPEVSMLTTIPPKMLLKGKFWKQLITRSYVQLLVYTFYVETKNI